MDFECLEPFVKYEYRFGHDATLRTNGRFAAMV
jgi:hypothetical protein